MARPEPPAPRPEGEAPPSFEQALERLEVIVEELEAGSLTLEQSIDRYEEGVRLSRRLSQTLDEAEKRIERLTTLEDGSLGTVPVDLDADVAEPEPPRPRADAAERGSRKDARSNPPREAARGGQPPGGDELPF